MTNRKIKITEVPGIETVEHYLHLIDPGIAISQAAYDFDLEIYQLQLNAPGKNIRVEFDQDFLNDLAKKPSPTPEIRARLRGKLDKAVGRTAGPGVL
jgi:hypothetical protein